MNRLITGNVKSRFSLIASNINGTISTRNHSTGIKTGILMLNMGGPATLEEVEPFLTRLFTDKDIIPLPAQSTLGAMIAKRRAPKVAKKYAEIGGGSPIRKWTEQQGQLLVNLLDKISPESGPHKFYVGFRYAEPLTEDTLEQMERDGVVNGIAFSQYPQYSCSTGGSSLNVMSKFYTKRVEKSQIHWSIIDRWPVNEGLVHAFADLINKELKEIPSSIRDQVVLLFSAHALPMTAVNKGDTYPAEVAATVIKVMESLNWKYPYRLVWQSKVGPMPWLSPQTDDALRGFVANGHKHFLIIPISFVNDHIETLHELDIEYAKELAEELGIDTIRRVPAPNVHPLFIDGLATVVRDHIKSGEICSKQLTIRCPLCSKAACIRMRQWVKSLETSK